MTPMPTERDQLRRGGGRMKRTHPNNYFHVRVYTADGGKIEFFRDKKHVSTRAQIIAGLREAIALIEKLDAAESAKAAGR